MVFLVSSLLDFFPHLFLLLFLSKSDDSHEVDDEESSQQPRA